MSTLGGVFGHIIGAILGATPSGEGTIFQPQSLTRGQVQQFNSELTRAYGAPYVAMLQATARKR